MPAINAANMYKKWILDVEALIDAGSSAHTRFPEAATLISQRRATAVKRKKLKEDDDKRVVHAMLTGLDRARQIERDIAMWYGYCLGDSAGARMALHIFGAMKAHGVMYRKRDGTWADVSVDMPELPVASLLSHGGRILFQLPMSNSAAREFGNTALAVIKGVTGYELAKSTFGNNAVGKGWKEKVSGPFVGILSTLGTFHKASAAGDDRMFDYLMNGDLHARVAATHSTVQTDWTDPPDLMRDHHMWFTEEKAKGGSHHLSNARDALMGRHAHKNVALGGVGKLNPYSGVKVDKAGGHGHLYVNYRAPQYKRFGAILLGVEGSAPGSSNQYGKVHDANAVKGEFSATGGEKWGTLYNGVFWEPPEKEKDDVTQFVCDLSYLPTSESKAKIENLHFAASDLGTGPNAVPVADWINVHQRL
ncbi:MAG: uncharacterized protein JWO88_3573 [Frankiales bacterium]|nr:uncharacterized protein [Frankiales bacterium]